MKDHEIPVGQGVTVLARVVVPTPRNGEDGAFPVLFWIHGGGKTLWNETKGDPLTPSSCTNEGFALGDRLSGDYWLRIASVKARVAIVNCEYRCVSVDLSMEDSSTHSLYKPQVGPRTRLPYGGQ